MVNAIYACLITMVFTVALLPVIDRLNNKNAQWTWRRSVVAYGVLSFSIAVLPILVSELIPGEYLFLVSALTVAVAALLSPITYLGTSVVLVLTTVLLPISFLYEMTAPMGIPGALTESFRTLDFWSPFAMPLASAFLVLLLTRKLQQRWKKPV